MALLDPWGCIHHTEILEKKDYHRLSPDWPSDRQNRLWPEAVNIKLND